MVKRACQTIRVYNHFIVNEFSQLDIAKDENSGHG
jgi:hypothetical protein